MRVERELMRGAGPVAVLKLLESGAMYGYELIEALDRRSAGVLAMGQSTLYPLLYNLDAQGLVVAEWRNGDSGRQANTTPSPPPAKNAWPKTSSSGKCWAVRWSHWASCRKEPAHEPATSLRRNCDRHPCLVAAQDHSARRRATRPLDRQLEHPAGDRRGRLATRDRAGGRARGPSHSIVAHGTSGCGPRAGRTFSRRPGRWARRQRIDRVVWRSAASRATDPPLKAPQPAAPLARMAADDASDRAGDWAVAGRLSVSARAAAHRPSDPVAQLRARNDRGRSRYARTRAGVAVLSRRAPRAVALPKSRRRFARRDPAARRAAAACGRVSEQSTPAASTGRRLRTGLQRIMRRWQTCGAEQRNSTSASSTTTRPTPTG